MRHRATSTWVRALASVVGVSIVIAACGSDEEPSSVQSGKGGSETGGSGGTEGGTTSGGATSGGTAGRGGTTGVGGTGADGGSGDEGGSGGSTTGGSTSTGGSTTGGSTSTGGKGGMPPVPPGTIAGFGVNGQPRNWGTDGRTVKPALDQLVNDLGANLFRIEIYHGASDWEATNDDDDATTFDWAAFDSIFEGKRFTDLWNYIRHLNGLGVTEIELAAHGLVPNWMGASSVSTAMEAEYVETLVAVLVYARTRAPAPRPVFTMFSPWNETDLGPPEGISLAPSRGVPLLRRLVDRMNAIPELDGITIVGPETASENASVQWRSAMLDDAVITARVRATSFHRYGPGGPTDDWHGASPPAWLTEFNDSGGFCYTVEWSNAVGLAGNLIGALQSGVTAGLVWADYDAAHIHSNDRWETFGLLATSYQGSADLCETFSSPPSNAQLDMLTYAPKHTYHAMKHIARYVERGAEQIEINVDGYSDAAGFRNPDGSIVIVGVNANSSETVTIDFADAALAPSSMVPIISTNGSYLDERPAVALVDSSVSVSVPGSSVFTLVGN